MAVCHFAYTFDPRSFVATLRDCIARDGRLDLERLHDRAKSALEAPSKAAGEALIAIRYSDTWIEAPEDEADLPEKWFVTALTGHFCIAPSLGRQRPAHHVILEALLPGTGMLEADIQHLIHGDDLVSILTDSGVAMPPGRLGALRDFGGWLSPASIGGLRQELERVRGHFLNIGPEHRTVLARIHPDWGADADRLAREAHAAAQEMLECAQRRKQALYVLLD